LYFIGDELHEVDGLGLLHGADPMEYAYLNSFHGASRPLSSIMSGLHLTLNAVRLITFLNLTRHMDAKFKTPEILHLPSLESPGGGAVNHFHRRIFVQGN